MNEIYCGKYIGDDGDEGVQDNALESPTVAVMCKLTLLLWFQIGISVSSHSNQSASARISTRNLRR